MKALTVQQPWAWAIIHGGKDVENRTQAWSYRGPLAIHAGARWSDRGGRSGLIWRALSQQYGWPTGPVTARDDPRRGFDCIRPLGAIIGVVDLVDAHHYVGSGPDAIDCCHSVWAEERYDEQGGKTRLDVVHLVLENPRPLPTLIPCRGALGLWTPPTDVLERLG